MGALVTVFVACSWDTSGAGSAVESADGQPDSSTPIDLQPEQLLPQSGSGDGLAYQTEPALAFGAGVYLSAWVDHRVESGNRAGDVFVARWSDSGELLDPAGIAVGMAP